MPSRFSTLRLGMCLPKTYASGTLEQEWRQPTHPHRTHIKIELTSILEVDTFKVNDKMKMINYDGNLKNEATTRVMKTTFLSKDLFLR